MKRDYVKSWKLLRGLRQRIILLLQVRYFMLLHSINFIKYIYTPKFKTMHFYCSFPDLLLRSIFFSFYSLFSLSVVLVTWFGSIRRSKVLNWSQISVGLSAENISEDASIGFAVSKCNALVLCHGDRFLVQVITWNLNICFYPMPLSKLHSQINPH